MKEKWYRSKMTKTILIALEHIFAVTIIVSFLWVMIYPAVRDEIFEGNQAEKYEDSRNFENQMCHYAFKVAKEIGAKEMFETDGKFDPDKHVDIQEYEDSTTVSGENTSGLSYRLGDLLDWGAEGIREEDWDQKENIIVCKKPDGTFYYYRGFEFLQLVESGQLEFVMSGNDGRSEAEIIDELLNQQYDMYSSQAEFKGLQNAKGEMVYIDCWSYDGYMMEELKSPDGAESILDIVNTNPKWNGRLNDAYNMVSGTINGLKEFYGEYKFSENNLAEGDTNFSYIYVNTKTGQIVSNQKAFRDITLLDENLETLRQSGKYVFVYPKLADFESNIKNVDANGWRDVIKYNGETENDFIFAAAVDTTYPVQDGFYMEDQLYSKYGTEARKIAVLGLAAFVLFVAGLIWLIWIAGRSSDDEELHLCRFDYWKTEIAAVLVIGVWMVPMMICVSGFELPGITYGTPYEVHSNYASDMVPYMIIGAGMAAYTCAMFLIGLLSLVRRIKARRIWKDSVLRSICRFVKHVFDHLHCIWKTILLFGAFVLIHWLAYMTYYSLPIMVFVAFGAEIAAFVYLIRSGIGKNKIRKGIEKISTGEVDYKIPLEGLSGEQKIIAEDINSIGEGLDAAVEKSMKSERLKTDLITNVSHDIKTPLTSIINYVDLLKKENLEDPKIQHYIEVLEQKAQRLKTLTEDVVEASKVSSGNISLEYMTLNLAEMVQQTSGEFAEKFAAKDLTEVMNIPEGDALIRADGRRTWRILENIYNNAAKYAMKGTRVYADLKLTDKTVIFNLKNVSEQPLNFAADELTERFIRGDVSRSTEGSGLGLSIAKTLTQMQGGTFELYLDGDLFKVTITFPRVDKMK